MLGASLGSLGMWIFGPVYIDLYGEYKTKWHILKQFKTNISHLDFLPRNSNSGETLKQEKRMNFEPNKSILSVVVGESGIGKTTEICQYVEELRKAELPVIYVSLEKNTNFKFEDFMKEIFGTSDRRIIIETIENNYTKKGIVPTLIIDNIHYAVINEKIDTGLLTFLNGQFYQGLKMAIIMLASVNGAAYEIDNCKFTFFFPFL